MNEIVRKESPIAQISVEDMILRGIDKGLSVDSLERLLAMRTEIKKEAAKEAYYSALSAFQAKCPPIGKTRIVKDKQGKERYSYAALDDIVGQVSELLKENGFSYSIKTENTDTSLTAVCQIHHIQGHTEQSSFTVPIDKEAYMNDSQKVGSASSFAKRYAFCNALGILTSDKDDDGNSTGEAISAKDIYYRSTQHMNAVREYWDSIGRIRECLSTDRIDEAAEALSEIPRESQMALWLATTKGGIFTTDERNLMRSTAFLEAYKQFLEPNEDVPQ